MDRRYLDKLEVYEEIKFKELNNSVLDETTERSLADDMQAMGADLVDYTQKFSLFSKKKYALAKQKIQE